MSNPWRRSLHKMVNGTMKNFSTIYKVSSPKNFSQASNFIISVKIPIIKVNKSQVTMCHMYDTKQKHYLSCFTDELLLFGLKNAHAINDHMTTTVTTTISNWFFTLNFTTVNIM